MKIDSTIESQICDAFRCNVPIPYVFQPALSNHWIGPTIQDMMQYVDRL
jgi:hypothetical protein